MYPGLGRPDGGFPDLGFWTRLNRKLHINTLELKAEILALHHWVSVLRGHQLMIATDNTSLYQQTGWDPFSHPVTSSSGSVPMATNSGHSHSGQTHSGLSKCDSGPPIVAEPGHLQQSGVSTQK